MNQIEKEKKTRFWKNRKYLMRIVVLLLVFVLFVTLPFSWLLQARAQRYMAQSIDSSNQLFLQQMKNDYLLFKENMSSLALSVFFREDIQSLLYSTQMTTVEVYNALKSINGDILTVQPSVYSIEMYNARNGVWYSTRTDGVYDGEELSEYISQNTELPKLTPVLRKIKVNDRPEAYTYVFSYFMWDYYVPSSEKSSLMVVNQKASWFMEALTTVGRSAYDTKTFLVSQEGEIYDYAGSFPDAQEERLISECIENRKQGEITQNQGNYISESPSGKYLISYLSLEGQGDVIILLQNYDQVFSSLKQMHREFLVLVVTFLIVGIGIILLISRRLYKPVNELVTSAEFIDEANSEEESSDEFTRLQMILQQSHKRNQTLREEKMAREDVLRRLMLIQLLHNADEEAWKKYREILPDTELSRQTEWNLCVIVLTINYTEDNRFGIHREREELILFAVYNIFSELLEGNMVERIKQHEGESVMVVNLTAGTAATLETALDRLRQLVLEILDISITVGCSGLGSSIHQLPKLYREAQACLNYRMVFGDSTTLTMQMCKPNEENPNVSYSPGTEKRLMEHIRMKKLEKALEDLDDICGEIRQLRYNYILVNVMELTAKLKSCLGEVYGLRMRENYAALYDRILEEKTLVGVFIHLKEHLRLVMDEREQENTETADAKNKQFVDRVVAYVERNYADSNLSLQSIADYMNLSSRYVSKKYRQCTDMSINDYILGFRMKQAADMLINTDMTVDQIAGRIGIENNNYFYHLFKKQYGCTPREFAVRAREHKEK